MILAGIDYSLTGPAICIFNGIEFNYSQCTFYFLTDVKKHAEKIYGNIFAERFVDWNHEMERYETIADWAMDILSGCDAVGLEGYAYSATGRVFSLAENTGVLKYKMYQAGLPVTIFTPSEIKKYATNKGNADKSLMYDAFLGETLTPIKDFISPNKKEIGNPVSDIVDSFFICKFLYDKIIREQNRVL